MKQLYVFILFILVMIFQGCAVNPSRYAPEAFTAESETGAIAGTVTIIDEKPRYNAYDIYYRKENADRKKRYRMSNLENRTIKSGTDISEGMVQFD